MASGLDLAMIGNLAGLPVNRNGFRAVVAGSCGGFRTGAEGGIEAPIKKMSSFSQIVAPVPLCLARSEFKRFRSVHALGVRRQVKHQAVLSSSPRSCGGSEDSSSNDKERDGTLIIDPQLHPRKERSTLIDTPEFDAYENRGWSEAITDEGSLMQEMGLTDVRAPAPVANKLEQFSAERRQSMESKLDQILEDDSRSAKDYRRRANLFTTNALLSSRQNLEVLKSRESCDEAGRKFVKIEDIVQNLETATLAEEGRSAADYNCRARIFEKTSEVFTPLSAEAHSWNQAILETVREERMESMLQQLEAIVLEQDGRSAADYSKRADAFMRTADVFGTIFTL